MGRGRYAKFHNIVSRVAGSAARLAHPSLSELYGHAVDQDAGSRNPVIVMPGIMGSVIQHVTSGKTLWGGPERNDFADPTDDEQLRLVSHPMQPGATLRDMTDGTRISGTVTKLRAKLFGFPLSVQAYGPILSMLGVGGFLNQEQQGKRKRLESQYSHRSIATCFEFAYDWRRSVPENAALLATFIDNVREFAAYDAKVGDKSKIKIDVVAHSMGGLLLRYFLRYGATPLHELGDSPEPNWLGAEVIEHAIMVGTPNAGSMQAMEKLLGGLPASPATPAYPPATLCTMPSIYQLLPRVRHEAFDMPDGTPVGDYMDPELWARNRWGLMSEESDEAIGRMYPALDTKAKRESAAFEHTALCLDETKRFHAAMDLPRDAPPTVAKLLFAGDGVMTPCRAIVRDRSIEVTEYDYGDGTVLRSSALMDERTWRRDQPRVLTPIRWEAVTFVPADHMMLTRHPTFVNNALYMLLEKPRPDCGFRNCFESQQQGQPAEADTPTDG
ncbi:MAG: hypothetical protein AAGF47_10215 [Planctomycetota bacterium]